MRMRQTVYALLLLAMAAAASLSLRAAAAAETFTATATVKAAGGATATAPVTIVIERKTSEAEAERLRAAFESGGAAALRKALAALAPTGSIQLGSGSKAVTRLTLERPTDKGRLLTILSDEPVLFLGAGVPGAKPKDRDAFTLLDIEVAPTGSGSGTLAPAAKIALKGGAFVVADYASELVLLTDVKQQK